jgi:hypothetical protein
MDIIWHFLGYVGLMMMLLGVAFVALEGARKGIEKKWRVILLVIPGFLLILGYLIYGPYQGFFPFME